MQCPPNTNVLVVMELVLRVEVVVSVPNEVTVGVTNTVGAVEVTVVVVGVGQVRVGVRGSSGPGASFTARFAGGGALAEGVELAST